MLLSSFGTRGKLSNLNDKIDIRTKILCWNAKVPNFLCTKSLTSFKEEYDVNSTLNNLNRHIGSIYCITFVDLVY